MTDPCINIVPGSAFIFNEPIRSRDGHVEYDPDLVFYPKTVQNLQEIIRCAERQDPPRRVRACGSRWSFTEIHKADNYLIMPEGLSGIFSAGSESNHSLLPFHIPLKPDVFNQVAGLVHVKSGTKLRDLYSSLVSLGLALPTQGGGTGGATIGGITSSGTHGSDPNLGGLAEYIRAIHIVGTGGRQYWLERSDPNNITEISRWPDQPIFGGDDFKAIYDDDTFDAAIVGIGSFGVIYSFVYEVLPSYYLLEERKAFDWPYVRDTVLSTGDIDTILSQTFSDIPDPYTSGRPRFFQVDLSLGTFKSTNDGPSVAYVTRRWEVDPITPSAPVDTFVLDNLWELGVDFFLDPHNALLMAELGIQNPGELVSVMTEGVFHGRASRFSNLLNGVPNLTRQRFNEFLMKEIKEQAGDFALGLSHEIDGGTQAPFLLPTGDSVEYIFDSASTAYLEFIDFILDKSKDSRSPDNPSQPEQMFGWISVRFSAQSKALIGMHRYPRSVAVEVASIKHVRGYEDFRESMQAEASRLGGIPHWGHLHGLQYPEEVSKHYGNDLNKWRRALWRLTRKGNSKTFENDLTISLQLTARRNRDGLLLGIG